MTTPGKPGFSFMLILLLIFLTTFLQLLYNMTNHRFPNEYF